jgi:dihydrolipoamide dehydrogenase
VLIVEQDGERRRLPGDYIIVAAGRDTRATREALGLENTDVEITEDGVIRTDNRMRTTDENILCVGDAAGKPHLAHVAYREGKVAGGVAAGEDVAFDNQYIPAVMFTVPEVAVVGRTEAEAADRYEGVKTGRFLLNESG